MINNTKLPYEFCSDDFQDDVAENFDYYCLAAFKYQYGHSEIYREFCRKLAVGPDTVKAVDDIPFLPIEFFKTERLLTGPDTAALVFKSSGTGGQRSHHFIADPKIYEESILRGFQNIYGHPSAYHILALLPSYIEREDASLVYMAEKLIQSSAKGSAFHNDHVKLREKLLRLRDTDAKVILLGVTFALLDFIETQAMDFKSLIVMETGGMKGMRKELIREDVHERLKQGFNISEVHSEYGMTELLSQAYSCGDGIFNSPGWMRILVRDPNDPFSRLAPGKSGAVNIIDLANIHSCAFIASDDIGKIHKDGSFEILGRLDGSELRGCNLMPTR